MTPLVGKKNMCPHGRDAIYFCKENIAVSKIEMQFLFKYENRNKKNVTRKKRVRRKQIKKYYSISAVKTY